jgi:hypothetical protein
MSITPPLGGEAPPLRCNRLTGGSFDRPEHCDRAATHHIIWTADLENGLCCDEHYQEAKQKWAFFGAHAYEMACSMPGATYLPGEDRCVVNEELLGLCAHVAEEISA